MPIPLPTIRIVALLYLAAFSFAASAEAPIPIALAPEGAHEMTLIATADGVFEISTTGTDPFLYTLPLPKGTTIAPAPVLEFEYFSLTGTGRLQCFIVPPGREDTSVKGPGLSRSEGWSSYHIDLWPARERAGQPFKQIRIDFGQEAGQSAQIRNIMLRARTPEEQAEQLRKTDVPATKAEEGVVPLSILPKRGDSLTVEDMGDGMFELKMTETFSDHMFMQPLNDETDLAQTPVLTFEYLSSTGLGSLSIGIEPDGSAKGSAAGPYIGRAQSWTPYRAILSTGELQPKGPVTSLYVYIDGAAAGQSAQIRNVALRGLEESEHALLPDLASAANLRSYLHDDMHSGISVSVSETTVDIRGSLGLSDGDNKDAAHWLVEMPVEADYANTSSLKKVERVTAGWDEDFAISVPRYTEDGRDRLYSRWAILQEPSEYESLITFGTYATSVKSRPGLTEAKPRNRKGLGGFSPGRPVEDIEALGVSAVTVNIMLDSFMRTAPGAGRTPYEYAGRTWYTDDAAVANLDDHMRSAAKFKLVVSAIILLNQATGAPEGDFRRLVAHPDADPSGIFVMPNFTSEPVNFLIPTECS